VLCERWQAYGYPTQLTGYKTCPAGLAVQNETMLCLESLCRSTSRNKINHGLGGHTSGRAIRTRMFLRDDVTEGGKATGKRGNGKQSIAGSRRSLIQKAMWAHRMVGRPAPGAASACAAAVQCQLVTTEKSRIRHQHGREAGADKSVECGKNNLRDEP